MKNVKPSMWFLTGGLLFLLGAIGFYVKEGGIFMAVMYGVCFIVFMIAFYIQRILDY